MREVNVKLQLKANLSDVFRELFLSNQFKRSFHERKRDEQITISDWIMQAANETIGTRISYFTMVERDSSDTVVDRTKCIEVEKFKFERDDVAVVESTMKPDTAIGALFVLYFTYTLQQHAANDRTTQLSIRVNIDCLKKWFGVTSVVEGLIEKQVKKTLEIWSTLAFEATNNLVGSSSTSSDSTSNAAVSASTSTSSATTTMMIGSSGPPIPPTPTSDYLPRLRLAHSRALNGARELIDLLTNRPDEYRQLVSRPDDESLRRVTTMSDEFGNLTIVFNANGGATSGDSNAAVSSSYASALRRRRDRFTQRYAVCLLTAALLIVVSLFGLQLLFELKRPRR